MKTTIAPALEERAAQFVARAAEIVKTYTDPLEKAAVPALIYHYTTSGGLEGILRSGKLWLSDAFEMNDQREIQHGVDVAIDVLKRRAEDAHPAIGGLSAYMERTIQPNVRHTAHYLIASFSELPNHLPQWQEYADDACGYELAFDCAELERSIKEAGTPGYASFPVSYEAGTLRDLLEKLIDEVIQAILFAVGRRQSRLTLKAYVGTLIDALSSEILHCSIYFKDASFRHEREYRFMQILPVDTPAGSLLQRRRYEGGPRINYREWDWRGTAHRALKGVVLGPASQDPLALESAGKLLKECLPGRDDITLSRSPLPYRLTRPRK